LREVAGDYRKKKEQKTSRAAEMNTSFGFEGWKLIDNSRETAEEGAIILMM